MVVHSQQHITTIIRLIIGSSFPLTHNNFYTIVNGSSSSTFSQQGQSHMDLDHLSTRDPSTGTVSLAVLELWKKRTHSKDILRQHYFSRMHKISTFVSSFYIIIYHKFLCTLLFSIIPCDCLIFYIVCYYKICQSYLHM